MPRIAAGEVLVGRYKLETVVGRGGMGEVWAAYDQKLGRKVALKIVALDIGEVTETRARFQREAELSRQLRGPAFVEVFDHGMLGSHAYLSMELLVGESLLERIKREPVMRPAAVLEMTRSLADGLRVAHVLQIVHRDLKPSNIFFARPGLGSSGVQRLDGTERETVKLLDFGIAKDAWDSSRLTRPGVLLGSAFYMSPEQVRSGSDVDARSDLWSLGVILYRCLTGERAFAGDAAQVLANIVHTTPRPASLVAPHLPLEIDAFFKRAFAKDPARRFSTIDELLEELEAALAGGADPPPQRATPVDDVPTRAEPSAPERSGARARQISGSRPIEPRFATPPTAVVPARGASASRAPDDIATVAVPPSSMRARAALAEQLDFGDVEPAPSAFVEPAPSAFVEPAPSAFVEPAPSAVVEPAPTAIAAPIPRAPIAPAPLASAPLSAMPPIRIRRTRGAAGRVALAVATLVALSLIAALAWYFRSRWPLPR